MAVTVPAKTLPFLQDGTADGIVILGDTSLLAAGAVVNVASPTVGSGASRQAIVKSVSGSKVKLGDSKGDDLDLQMYKARDGATLTLTAQTLPNATATPRGVVTGTTADVCGKATLVAGTVTITTTAIKATDLVSIGRMALGGAAGHLSLGTVTADTSFVINSSSGTDTSVVFWEIIRTV